MVIMKSVCVLLLVIVALTEISNAQFTVGGYGRNSRGNSNNKQNSGGALGGLGGVLGGLLGVLGGQPQTNNHKEEETNMRIQQPTHNQNQWNHQNQKPGTHNQNHHYGEQTASDPYHLYNTKPQQNNHEDVPQPVNQIPELYIPPQIIEDQRNNYQNEDSQSYTPTGNQSPTNYIDRDIIPETDPKTPMTVDDRYDEPTIEVIVDPNDLQVKAVTPNPE